MATKKNEIQKKITKLNKQYETIQKSLKEAGIDINDAAKVAKITSFEGLSGTVSEFLDAYKKELVTLEQQLQSFNNTSKKSKKKVLRSADEIKAFQTIITKLNKQIIKELPEHEKEYEQLAQTFEQERESFQKTHGSYSQYSKHILSEIDRIQEAAKEKGATAKDLENYAEQVKVLNETLSSNLGDTEERANVLGQLSKADIKLQKDLREKKRIFNRIGAIASKHKITASALIAGVTMSNPLAMWGVEAFGNMMGNKSDKTAQQKQYKLRELLKSREIFKGQTTEGISGRQFDFGEDMSSRRSRVGGDDVLDELKLQTNLLRKIVGVDEKFFEFDKEKEAQRQRDLEDSQSSAEEAALESGNKPIVGQNLVNNKKTSVGLDAESMSALGTEIEKAGVIAGALGGVVGWLSSIIGGVFAVLTSATAGLVVAAAAGIVLTFKNMLSAKLKAKDWGVDVLSAKMSQTLLPALLGLAGLIFAWPVALIGMAVGAVAQYLLPEKWKMQLAQWTQVAKDSILNFGNRVEIAVSYIADAFTDLVSFMMNIVVDIKLAILKLKMQANKITAGLGGGFVGAIFDEEKLQKETQSLQNDKKQLAAKMDTIHASTGSSKEQARQNIQQRNAETEKRLSEAKPTQSVELEMKEKSNSVTGALGFNLFGPENIQESKNRSDANQYQTPANQNRQVETPLNIKPGAGTTTSGTMALAKMVNSGDNVNRFTAFNDQYHAGKNSKHNQGLAMDYTVKDPSHAGAEANRVRSLMDQAGVKGRVINEYDNPSSGSTGGHIHAQFQSQADAEKFAAYSEQNTAAPEGRTMMAENATAVQTGPQRSADVAPAPSNTSQQYLAANADNSSAKMSAAAPSNAPIIVNTGGGQSNAPTQMASNNSSRAAPRGNEPVLQSALNADFSGSTS